MTITRRQHYVWKHYLTAWATGKTVRALAKDGRAFATNPINLAVSRDFYRLPVLTAEDEQFISYFLDHSGSPAHILQLNRESFMLYAMASRVRRKMGDALQQHPELAEALETAEIQAEESFHAGVETDAMPLLDQLRQGSSAFWQAEDDALTFSFFISLQHLRTKRMQSVYVAKFPEETRGLAERTWPLLRMFSAAGMGWSLWRQRAEFTFAFITAPPGVEFITSDQPARNLVPPTGHNDLALFYPVSPDLAVIFKHPGAPATFDSRQLTADEVADLNAHTYAYALETVFGRSAAALDAARARAETLPPDDPDTPLKPVPDQT
jgi:hypothetical protein